MPSASDLVREVVESCWTDDSGAARLRDLVTTDYVHHTPVGDWDVEQLIRGLAWVGTRLAERQYRVEHVVVGGDMAAAFVTWTAREIDGGAVADGRGAYHCRIRDGRICEDWDVFHPMPS